MRRASFVLFFILLGSFLTAKPPERIAYVWAGHPVGFGLLVEQGHLYVAYYDADRRITLIGRKLDETTWTRMKPTGIDLPERGRNSRFTGWDSLGFLRLGLDETGRVHLAGNMHDDPLIYFRMENPHDVKSLIRVDRMTGEREQRCSYPLFFKGPNNVLFFRFREGDARTGEDLYNCYDAATSTWRRVAPPLGSVGRGTGEAHGFARSVDSVPQTSELVGPAVSGLPLELRAVQSTYPGLEVQTQEVRGAGKRWILRWETLPRNGDKPRETFPEAQPLQLFELPDDGD